MRWNLIVAVSKNGVIGNQGALPWHLPCDLAHFKAMTLGHPILMGRKTFESIGRPLPSRLNIVLTRDVAWTQPGIEVIHRLDDAQTVCQRIFVPGQNTVSEEIFVIGGSQIYEQALPRVSRLFLTVVDTECEGDATFKFDNQGWRCTSRVTNPPDEKNILPCEFQCWERVVSA